MYFLPLSDVLRKSSCELYEETFIAENCGDAASNPGTQITDDVVTAEKTLESYEIVWDGLHVEQLDCEAVKNILLVALGEAGFQKDKLQALICIQRGSVIATLTAPDDVLGNIKNIDPDKLSITSCQPRVISCRPQPLGDAAAKAWALSWFRSLASCGGTRSEPFHNPFQRFAGRKSSLEHFVENPLF